MCSTRDRLEEWFSRMGFASAPQLAEDCMAHGDMEVWRVAHVVPDARMRVSMQWCYSPERYLTDVHGYPQGQLRVAVGYRKAFRPDMSGAERDRLWDETARAKATASKAARKRSLPLSDGTGTNGRLRTARGRFGLEHDGCHRALPVMSASCPSGMRASTGTALPDRPM